MDKQSAMAKLEEISKKPKYYFFYDVGDSYAHEIDKEDDPPDMHIGGVEDVKCVRTSHWNSMGSVSIEVQVEDNIILTDDAYLKMFGLDGKVLAIFPYNLYDAKDIRDIWDERFKSANSEF